MMVTQKTIVEVECRPIPSEDDIECPEEIAQEMDLASNQTFQTFLPEDILIIEKINKQYIALTKYFKERKEPFQAMYACLLAKQHFLMMGPPGIAKSAMIDGFAAGLQSFRVFKRLLTKTTTPDEIFGPISLPDLKNGKYTRIYTNKFGDCEFSFLDEVFNAGSPILNTLLQAINERCLDDLPSIPLECLFGATNNIPEDNSTLAFFDRFLVRFIMRPISDGRNFESMLKSARKFEMPANLVVTRAEIEQLRQRLINIDTSAIIPKIKRIWMDLKKENIYPSDRRFRWALELCQANALLHKRTKVAVDDLEILTSVLWTDVKEIPLVETTLLKYMNSVMIQVKQLVQQAAEIRDSIKNVLATDKGGVQQITEVLGKLKINATSLKELYQKADSDAKPAIKEALEEINNMGKQLQQEKTSFLMQF